PAWNNTFSHPEEDHWLTDNHFLEIPFLSARMGISEKMDFGLGFTKNIEANYGWLSADIKYAITKMKGYDIATRASYTSLIGVADFDINQGAVDFIISKSFFSFNPYVGVTAVYTTSNETTSKVVLERIHNMAGETILGATYQWKYLNVAAEVDFARVNMYSLKIGAIF
ncbi:MAG: hypothetical protein OEX19_14585, partial [Gammaproteobacteria bacterium]|nr:hypothetical protein [Gammaproteobacteria bacterium]